MKKSQLYAIRFQVQKKRIDELNKYIDDNGLREEYEKSHYKTMSWFLRSRGEFFTHEETPDEAATKRKRMLCSAMDNEYREWINRVARNCDPEVRNIYYDLIEKYESLITETNIEEIKDTIIRQTAERVVKTWAQTLSVQEAVAMYMIMTNKTRGEYQIYGKYTSNKYLRIDHKKILKLRPDITEHIAAGYSTEKENTMSKKKYYVPFGEYFDDFYGRENAVCVSKNEIKHLAAEWEMPFSKLFGQMREATAQEIEEYGISEYTE